MLLESPGKIRMGLRVFPRAVLVLACCACASTPAGEPEAGREPIIIHVDNQTSRVVTVDRIVAMGGGVGSTSFGGVASRRERPVTRRIGVVNGQSKRTLAVPWHPSRLAHEILWIEGVERVATDTETLGPGQHHKTYRVEQCRGTGLNACVQTAALHLPPGAEVTLVIDRRHEAWMYYDLPTEEVGRTMDGIPLR